MIFQETRARRSRRRRRRRPWRQARPRVARSGRTRPRRLLIRCRAAQRRSQEVEEVGPIRRCQVAPSLTRARRSPTIQPPSPCPYPPPVSTTRARQLFFFTLIVIRAARHSYAVRREFGGKRSSRPNSGNFFGSI